MRYGFLSACLVVAVAHSIAQADPPHVARASPDNGDTDVDPALKEIRIEFDQDMSHHGHSICGGGPSFPDLGGKPHWTAPRVMIIPVKLQPNRQYSFSINCPAAQNFRGRDGEPAEMYPISFRTSSAGKHKAAPRLTEQENRQAVTLLRQAIDESYSYRDLHGLDWKSLFRDAAPKLEKAQTPAEFARITAKLLANAKDLHITVRAGDAVLATHRRYAPANCNIVAISHAVPHWKKHNEAVSTGRFDDGIGYVLIATWGPSNRGMLDPAFDAIKETSKANGLIIDVRPNSGGDELLARAIAACFATRPAVYSRNVYRDSKSKSGFTKPLDRIIEPTTEHSPFHGKVAVLMGPQNMSSCESFLLMMRHGAGKQCRLFGERSYGSSGNPKPHDLHNGVTVLLPSWKDMDVDGTGIEGQGISPDVTIETTSTDLVTADPLLDAALKWLRE